MELTHEQVLHIASLVRMRVTQDEVERLRTQLSNILDQFQALQALDTTGVEPTGHAVPLHSVMRDDVPREPWPRDQVLRNAPRTEGEFIRVKAVLEE